MSEIKLLPCPFCGGEAEIEEDYSYGYGLLFSYKPHCSQCGCSIGLFSDKTEAITKWNTRKPMERIVRRLETIIGCELHLSCLKEKILQIVKEEGGIE